MKSSRVIHERDLLSITGKRASLLCMQFTSPSISADVLFYFCLPFCKGTFCVFVFLKLQERENVFPNPRFHIIISKKILNANFT